MAIGPISSPSSWTNGTVPSPTWFATVQSNSNHTISRVSTATAYSILITDRIVGVTDTSVARVMTLPAASSIAAGSEVVIVDESGGANANNISIVRAGSDTINGATSVQITANYGTKTLYSDGSTKWFAR